MVGLAIALHGPAARTADGDHPGVLPGAVVVDRLGRATLLDAAIELVLRAAGRAEEASDRRDVQLRAEVRGGGDRELLFVQVLACPREQQRLDRLRRRAQRDDEARVARFGYDGSVPDGRGVDAMD